MKFSEIMAILRLMHPPVDLTSARCPVCFKEGTSSEMTKVSKQDFVCSADCKTAYNEWVGY